MTNSVVIGTETLIRKFRAMSEAAQGGTLANVAKAGGLVIQNAARANIQKQGLIRTRTLSKSVHVEVVQQSKDNAAVEVGTNLEYAAIHEFGGTIRPKSAKYLAIPVGARTGSPRRHADLKVRKTPKGNLLLVDGGGVTQYVLKPSVTIPARPYLRPAIDEHGAEAQEKMGGYFKKIIKQAVA